VELDALHHFRESEITRRAVVGDDMHEHGAFLFLDPNSGTTHEECSILSRHMKHVATDDVTA
jgi:hypothetical protein